MCLVVYVQMSDLHLINVFCVVIFVKKRIMASSGNLVVFCTAQKQDTFGAHDQSYTVTQPAVQTATLHSQDVLIKFILTCLLHFRLCQTAPAPKGISSN